MTLNQAKMILQIAAIYGEHLNMDRIKELAVVIGGGFALRQVARTAIGFVPVLGWAIKSAVGYTGTFAMGNAALEYFERGGTPEGLIAKLEEVKSGLIETAQEKREERRYKSKQKETTLLKSPNNTVSQSQKMKNKKPSQVSSKPKSVAKEKRGYHKLA
jgi:uncharacterized protein (DUF697 family)